LSRIWRIRKRRKMRIRESLLRPHDRRYTSSGALTTGQNDVCADSPYGAPCRERRLRPTVDRDRRFELFSPHHGKAGADARLVNPHRQLCLNGPVEARLMPADRVKALKLSKHCGRREPRAALRGLRGGGSSPAKPVSEVQISPKRTTCRRSTRPQRRSRSWAISGSRTSAAFCAATPSLRKVMAPVYRRKST
jgi:hypothetical protein